MGVYINPPDKTKKEWLATHAQKAEKLPANWEDIPEGDLYLVWVDNGPFDALAVLFSPGELEYFQKDLPTDPRPYEIYTAKYDDVAPVTNGGLEEYSQ